MPPGAAMLLDFIYRTEAGRGPPECYRVIYGHNQDKLPKPLTSMTLDEVEAAQPGWTKNFGSLAAGAGRPSQLWQHAPWRQPAPCGYNTRNHCGRTAHRASDPSHASRHGDSGPRQCVEFIPENGGGAGVRWSKRKDAK